jgi:hypothetical protein
MPIELRRFITDIMRSLTQGGRREKSFRETTNDELDRDYLLWSERLKEASGWTSVLLASEQIESILREAKRRSLKLTVNR